MHGIVVPGGNGLEKSCVKDMVVGGVLKERDLDMEIYMYISSTCNHRAWM